MLPLSEENCHFYPLFFPLPVPTSLYVSITNCTVYVDQTFWSQTLCKHERLFRTLPVSLSYLLFFFFLLSSCLSSFFLYLWFHPSLFFRFICLSFFSYLHAYPLSFSFLLFRLFFVLTVVPLCLFFSYYFAFYRSFSLTSFCIFLRFIFL